MMCYYKMRLYPNRTQTRLINLGFDGCTLIWNRYLEKWKKAYEYSEKPMSYFDFSKDLTQFKKSFDQLRIIDSQALQYCIQHLDNRLKRFLKQTERGLNPVFPHFRAELRYPKSYKTQGSIHVFDKSVQLPKLGKVKCPEHQKIKGRILSAVVSQTFSREYFVYVHVDYMRDIEAQTQETSIITSCLPNPVSISYPEALMTVSDNIRRSEKPKKESTYFLYGPLALPNLGF